MINMSREGMEPSAHVSSTVKLMFCVCAVYDYSKHFNYKCFHIK